jgi:hypothetical protein
VKGSGWFDLPGPMKIWLPIAIGLLCDILLISSPVFPQSDAECLNCHHDQSLVKDKDGTKISICVNELVHNNTPLERVACITCHKGYNPEDIPQKRNIEPVNCLTCHTEAAQTHSVHPQLARAVCAGEEPIVSYNGCHGTHDIASLEVSGSE